MRFEAVTTCSLAGWKEYGRRMVESCDRFWPSGIPLKIYSEDKLPDMTHDFPAWHAAFLAKHGKSRNATGHGNLGRRPMAYNYRFDAVRFSYKTAAVIDAAQHSQAEFLVWIDADTVTHAPVTEEFLEDLTPDSHEVISWLYRTKTYPECGFYILNLRNPRTHDLLREWQALYTEGGLFQMAEWHDSYVLQQLVRSLQCSWRSISGGAECTSHPFINGPLGAVMDHLKGPRKQTGRSAQRDLKIIRNEAYWRK